MMIILMAMVLMVDEEERRKVWVWGRIYFHQHLEKKQQRESMNSHNHINAVKRKKRMYSNIIPCVKGIWIKCWNVPCSDAINKERWVEDYIKPAIDNGSVEDSMDQIQNSLIIMNPQRRRRKRKRRKNHQRENKK